MQNLVWDDKQADKNILICGSCRHSLSTISYDLYLSSLNSVHNSTITKIWVLKKPSILSFTLIKMTSKRNRKTLLTTAASAIASALAFYFTWKAFRSYDPDPNEDAPCGEDGDENELLDMENLMKTNEEKSGKVKGIAEEDSGFRLEEFEVFIAEKYGAVLVECVKKSLDCQEYKEPHSVFRVEEFEEFIAEKYGAVFVEGINSSLECEDSHKPTKEVFARNNEEESNLKVGFVGKEEVSHDFLSSFLDGLSLGPLVMRQRKKVPIPQQVGWESNCFSFIAIRFKL